MQIFRKLKTNKAAEELLETYRDKINNTALEALTTEDFENLVKIAKSASFGSATAIESAFCLGFTAGQTALKEKIENGFLKEGGDSNAE